MMSPSQLNPQVACFENGAHPPSCKSIALSREDTPGKSSTQSHSLIDLTSLQAASGSFRSDQIIADLVGKTLPEIDSEARRNNLEETVWFTALAVALLRSKFSEDKESWEMIAEKAVAWIKKTGQEPGDVLQLANL